MPAQADFIQSFANSLLDYALVLAAVGTISMALIELVKSVLDLRLAYNRGRLEKWSAGNASAGIQLQELATGNPVTPDGRTLISRITGEVRRNDVLFDQPAEKMLGQIQAAANVVMDFPYLYDDAYRLLTDATPKGPLTGDQKLWFEFAKAAAEGAKIPDKTARAATQARARLANAVSRKLDAFQNETQYYWAELNQRTAFVVGMVFLLYFLWPREAANDALPYLRAIVLAFFGGLVAPFAKDLVSALSGLTVKRAT